MEKINTVTIYCECGSSLTVTKESIFEKSRLSKELYCPGCDDRFDGVHKLATHIKQVEDFIDHVEEQGFEVRFRA